MRRILRAHFVLGALLVLLAAGTSTSLAGTLDDGKYVSSYGYEIEPPADWSYVDRGNHSIQKEKLPSELKRPKPDAFDVIFFDGELEETDAGKPMPIYDNIVVVVVPSLPEVTDDLGNNLAAAMKPHLEKLFAEVELVKTTKTSHGDADAALDLEWRVADAEGARKGYIIQSILPGVSRTVMVTCTIGDERWGDRRDFCIKTLDSIKINDK